MNTAYTLMDLADEYAQARAVAVRGEAVDQARTALLTALVAALADAERLRAGLLELRTVCEPEGEA